MNWCIIYPIWETIMNEYVLLFWIEKKTQDLKMNQDIWVLRHVTHTWVVKLIADIFQPAITISEDATTVTCVANTSSQHCVHRWHGNHVPTNVNIESLNQTLPLDESLNNLRCETKCRIRGDECSVTSSFYSSSTQQSKCSTILCTLTTILQLIVPWIFIRRNSVIVSIIGNA